MIRRECKDPEQEPVRETVVEEAANTQETAEKAKVELRKENETKEVVKPQEEKSGDCTGK